MSYKHHHAYKPNNFQASNAKAIQVEAFWNTEKRRLLL
jgi:hypothetical protein